MEMKCANCGTAMDPNKVMCAECQSMMKCDGNMCKCGSCGHQFKMAEALCDACLAKI